MTALPYLYRWDRQGRKGHPCEVLIRTKIMNSCLVEFGDGYRMVTSRNAIRKNPTATNAELPIAAVEDQRGKRG